MITEEHYGDIYETIERADRHRGLLAAWEQAFLEDWQAKLDLHGCRVTVSDKQQWVFNHIATKLDGAGVENPSLGARNDAEGGSDHS